jgi:hypothetical protein
MLIPVVWDGRKTILTAEQQHCQQENFKLQADSPAWKFGFKPLPIDKMGLYQDEIRASLVR